MAKKDIDKRRVEVLEMKTESLPTGGDKSAVERKRIERVPLSGANRLQAPERPGYFRKWVRDDNVMRHLEAGYAHVQKEMTKPGEFGFDRVGDATQMDARVVKDGGGGSLLYLMEILQEYRDEDLAAIQADIDERERAIRPSLESEAGRGRIYGKVDISTRQGGMR